MTEERRKNQQGKKASRNRMHPGLGFGVGIDLVFDLGEGEKQNGGAVENVAGLKMMMMKKMKKKKKNR